MFERGHACQLSFVLSRLIADLGESFFASVFLSLAAGAGFFAAHLQITVPSGSAIAVVVVVQLLYAGSEIQTFLAAGSTPFPVSTHDLTTSGTFGLCGLPALRTEGKLRFVATGS